MHISSLFADALKMNGFKPVKSNKGSLALQELGLRPDEFDLVLADGTSQTDLLKQRPN